MTATAPAISPTPGADDAPRLTWRERFKLTRTGVFSVVFLVLGLLMVLSAPGFDPAATSTLTIGGTDVAVPVATQAYAIIIGLLYALTGAFSLFVPARQPGMQRLRFSLLLLNGLLIFPTVLILVAVGKSTNLVTMASETLRLATPIVIGALAGIWCERAGVVNIGIEGMMLTGACFGFVAFTLIAPSIGDTQLALFIGVGVAVLSGGLMAVLHAWLCITFKTDQIVSGTVINILALGLTSFTRREVLLSTRAGNETLAAVPIPILSDIPVIGPLLFNGKPIFYGMFVLLIVTHIVLYYTRWGLRTRAVGENPHAADTLGINVLRNRWINVLIGGMIAGLAGAWLSIEQTGVFLDNMTDGRGFIALAAMIFGKWTPIGAFGGGVLFGFASALDTRFQILGVGIPPQFVQMTPYVVTMIVLAGLVGRAVAPKADGQPFTKE